MSLLLSETTVTPVNGHRPQAESHQRNSGPEFHYCFTSGPVWRGGAQDRCRLRRLSAVDRRADDRTGQNRPSPTGIAARKTPNGRTTAELSRPLRCRVPPAPVFVAGVFRPSPQTPLVGVFRPSPRLARPRPATERRSAIPLQISIVLSGGAGQYSGSGAVTATGSRLVGSVSSSRRACRAMAAKRGSSHAGPKARSEP